MSNIIINGRFLTQPVTGVQRYAIEMTRWLLRFDPTIQVVAPSNILHHNLADEWGAISIGKLKGHKWEQLELPRYLKTRNSPLLVGFGNTGPMGYANQVVTIHDLAFRVNPKWFSRWFAAWYNLLIPRLTRKSRKVITVSQFSAQEIQKHLGIPPENIEVLANGLPEANTESVPLPTIKGTYFLAVASENERKNMKVLLEAFRKLKDTDAQLILCGGASHVFRTKEKSHLFEGVNHLGYVDDSTLKSLYAHALAMVIPSLYEGFGIPNLEAMAANCPVVASDIPAFREVCGDAALYFNPNDADELAQELREITKNDFLRDELIERGKKRLSLFSYETSARKLLGILRNL